jgi:O-antigen biosynthesis protein
MDNIERMDDETPEAIVSLLQFPYVYFGNMLSSKDGTLLDIACGNGFQTPFLKDKFKNVISMDIDASVPGVVVGSITDIPLKSNEVEVAISLETIEHVSESDQRIAMMELIRVTSKYIVIGSVDETGEDFIDGIEIYKAVNGKNPHHLHEFNRHTFVTFIEEFSEYFTDIQYYQSSHNPITGFEMETDLQPGRYCNYAKCTLKG